MFDKLPQEILNIIYNKCQINDIINIELGLKKIVPIETKINILYKNKSCYERFISLNELERKIPEKYSNNIDLLVHLYKYFGINPYNIASKFNNINLMDNLKQNYKFIIPDRTTFINAIIYNNINILKYLFDKFNNSIDDRVFSYIFDTCAEYNKTEILRYIHYKFPQKKPINKILSIAIYKKNIDVIKLFIEYFDDIYCESDTIADAFVYCPDIIGILKKRMPEINVDLTIEYILKKNISLKQLDHVLNELNKWYPKIFISDHIFNFVEYVYGSQKLEILKKWNNEHIK